MDTVRAHRVGGYYRFCDVLLHLPEETVAIGEYPIEGLDRDLLQQVFLDGPAGAVHDGAAGFKAADASPDDTFAAVVIPVDSPVELATFSADNDLGGAVVVGVDALLTVRPSVNLPASNKLRLHLHEDFLRNDGFMVIFHIVLRQGTGVAYAFLGEEVRGYGFLEKGVAHVFLVSQDLVDGGVVPFCLARAGEDAVLLQSFGDLLHGETFEVLAVDSLDDLCLFRVDDEVPVAVLGISEKVIVIDLYLSLLVAVLLSELHILGKGLGFLLGEACHDGDQNLSLGVHRVDGFLLEPDRDVLFFQLPDVFQTVERIAGESADALGDDHVDVSGHALVDHAVEFITLLCIGATDSVIGEDPWRCSR